MIIIIINFFGIKPLFYAITCNLSLLLDNIGYLKLSENFYIKRNNSSVCSVCSLVVSASEIIMNVSVSLDNIEIPQCLM